MSSVQITVKAKDHTQRFKEKLCGVLAYICLTNRKIIWILLGPILPIPFLFANMGDSHTVTRCAYASIWMGIYWITEPIPIAATAFLPLLLFPLFGIVPATVVSSSYFNDTLFLLLASMMFATGLEKWKLHRKVALKFLLLVGSRPKILMLGFMAMTGFLSMWISNTATTAMMTPLAIAVLDQIEKGIKSDNQDDKDDEKVLLGVSLENNPSAVPLKEDSDSDERQQRIPLTNNGKQNIIEEFNNYSIGMLLGVCYSSSLGGTATLIGTGSNVVLTSQLKILFPDAPEISFGKWFAMAVPMASIMIVILWLILVLKYARSTSFKVDTSILQHYYDDLGDLTFPQKVMLLDFLMMIVLWFSRVNFDGTEGGGWSSFFEPDYVSDGTVCILGVIILFFIPSRVEPKPESPIFTKDIFKETPWDIIFLLAGGFGLAKGIAESGLAKELSSHLSFISALPLYFLLVVVCLVTVFMTEFTSNVSTITVFAPILAALAVGIKQNPLLLMIPATLSSSYAFMLPIATPPNAIVFSSGRMKVIDMVTTGGILNFLGLFLIPAFMMMFIGLFGIEPGVLPIWANT